MKFYDACKLAYKTFKEWDEAGINNIIDYDTKWIFGSGKMNEMSLASLVLMIDKKSGEISWNVPHFSPKKENILNIPKEFQSV